jgi:hypothetical protein
MPYGGCVQVRTLSSVELLLLTMQMFPVSATESPKLNMALYLLVPEVLPVLVALRLLLVMTSAIKKNERGEQ